MLASVTRADAGFVGEPAVGRRSVRLPLGVLTGESLVLVTLVVGAILPTEGSVITPKLATQQSWEGKPGRSCR